MHFAATVQCFLLLLFVAFQHYYSLLAVAVHFRCCCSISLLLFAFVDFYTLRKDIEAASKHIEEIRASASLQQLEKELPEEDMKAADSSFWEDCAKAKETLQALTDLKDKINLLTDFKTKMEPKIKESDYFKAKISNCSSLDAIEDIKGKLSNE